MWGPSFCNHRIWWMVKIFAEDLPEIWYLPRCPSLSLNSSRISSVESPSFLQFLATVHEAGLKVPRGNQPPKRLCSIKEWWVARDDRVDGMDQSWWLWRLWRKKSGFCSNWREGSKIGDFSSLPLLGRIAYPTYPLAFGTFWRWFSFCPGGIC